MIVFLWIETICGGEAREKVSMVQELLGHAFVLAKTGRDYWDKEMQAVTFSPRPCLIQK
jgi:hypothetical protein